MLNNANTTSPALVSIAVAAHKAAAAHLEAMCKRVRENTCAALDEIYEEDMWEAMRLFELACDDLRETRDGYRFTYPHPAALAPHGQRYPVR